MTAGADGSRPTGRAEVVEALLDVADRMFALDAPGDVSLRAIAREAGVNHGLVHRYFGTRDDLVDALMQRVAARWTAASAAVDGFDEAVDSILGSAATAEASAGTWLRLLAWSQLTDAPQHSGEVQRRHATLDELLPPLLERDDAEDARVATAVVLALVYGWRFFHPYLRAALHLDDVPFAELHDAVRAGVRALSSEAGVS